MKWCSHVLDNPDSKKQIVLISSFPITSKIRYESELEFFCRTKQICF